MENNQFSDKSDTVQGLFDEIEHLIDVPFQQFAHELHIPRRQDSLEHSVSESTNTPNQTFERPILIESDSDDVEEEQIVPNQAMYTLMTCYKCSKPIPSLHDKLHDFNFCTDCSSKKRSRSKSFTLDGNGMLAQFADKLKASLASGGSNNNLTLPSASKSMDRRKSMPSLHSNFVDESLEIPTASPTPSRPSSRASSFLEDVKQFLSPLSRKSSRNSLLQEDYQAQSPKSPKRSSSHTSLFDAISFCKPKQKQSSIPSYERRITSMIGSNQEDETDWAQEDKEVLRVQQRSASNNEVYIPIRRKQIKKIESRQERINIYNNAYIECMELQTDLVPWIVKQTQKGPPDAWFGYVPPSREPKKFMGLFKRKSKQADSNSLRTQQLQLGDELLNRATPLLNRQYSNGNLSIQPEESSYFYQTENEMDELTESPISQHHLNEELYEYEQPHNYQQQTDGEASEGHLDNRHEPSIMHTSRSSSTRPVSILKKTQSSRHLIRSPQTAYEYPSMAEDEYLSYEDYDPEDYELLPSNSIHDKRSIYLKHPGETRGSYRRLSSRGERDWLYSGRKHMTRDQRYPDSHSLRRKYSHQSIEYSDDAYYRSAQPSLHHNDRFAERDYYEGYNYDELPPSRSERRLSRSRYATGNHQYQDELLHDLDHSGLPAYPVEYQRPRRGSIQSRRKQMNKISLPNHYDQPVQLNPYISDEWENALDDLCDLFPRLDKHYVDEFLRSARGDFFEAKNMILDMIMKMP